MIRRPSARDRRASARERLVLSLRLLEGLSAPEAAAALHVTAREVEQRTSVALRSLAQELALRAALKRAA